MSSNPDQPPHRPSSERCRRTTEAPKHQLCRCSLRELAYGCCKRRDLVKQIVRFERKYGLN